MSTYAIISLGGKQYLVREGETLLVDRLKHGEGKTFQPEVLLVGGDGDTELSPSATVTAGVVGRRQGREDPDRQVQAEERLQAAHRLPRQPVADRDRVDRRRQEGCRRRRAEAAPAKKAEQAPKAEAAAPADDHVKGMPTGYED